MHFDYRMSTVEDVVAAMTERCTVIAASTGQLADEIAQLVE